jgi:hypothetical protein
LMSEQVLHLHNHFKTRLSLGVTPTWDPQTHSFNRSGDTGALSQHEEDVARCRPRRFCRHALKRGANRFHGEQAQLKCQLRPQERWLLQFSRRKEIITASITSQRYRLRGGTEMWFAIVGDAWLRIPKRDWKKPNGFQWANSTSRPVWSPCGDRGKSVCLRDVCLSIFGRARKCPKAGDRRTSCAHRPNRSWSIINYDIEQIVYFPRIRKRNESAQFLTRSIWAHRWKTLDRRDGLGIPFFHIIGTGPKIKFQSRLSKIKNKKKDTGQSR